MVHRQLEEQSHLCRGNRPGHDGALLLTALALNKGVFFKSPIRLLIFMPYVSSIVADSDRMGDVVQPFDGSYQCFLEQRWDRESSGMVSAAASGHFPRL